MKLKVSREFRDKFTKKMYAPGAVIDIDDPERVADLVNRGLAEAIIEEVEEKPAPKKKSKK